MFLRDVHKEVNNMTAVLFMRGLGEALDRVD